MSETSSTETVQYGILSPVFPVALFMIAGLFCTVKSFLPNFTKFKDKQHMFLHSR